MPARCERVHRCIYSRGGWIVGRASSDDALALCSAPSARVPIHPVEADRIFCRDGNVWTSAGITAGIDLALALIEEDHGFATAKGVAQHLVVYHRRHGGQSQFAASVDLAPKNDRMTAALGYARDHIAEGLTVERLAEAAGMSLRQFSRLFRAQTGTTPARVVERLRADLARGRIETSAEPVERIAEAVGFGDAENMRRAFIRIYGQPPQSIRRAIRSQQRVIRAVAPRRPSEGFRFPSVAVSLDRLATTARPADRTNLCFQLRFASL
jgi:AraC-like DNA-binding protein